MFSGTSTLCRAAKADQHGSRTVKADQRGSHKAKADQHGSRATKADQHGSHVAKTDQHGSHAAKADQHGQQDCHACMRVHTISDFLGEFFQFTKNVCITKNSVIVSPGTEHTYARKKYKRQLLITAQYSCSTRQNNTCISSVPTNAIITHKQSAVFSTTQKSADEQLRHQCHAAAFDVSDNLPIKFLSRTASNGMPQPSQCNIHIYL